MWGKEVVGLFVSGKSRSNISSSSNNNRRRDVAEVRDAQQADWITVKQGECRAWFVDGAKQRGRVRASAREMRLVREC